MIQISEREKRTIRLGVIGLSVYLALFYGGKAWNYMQSQNQDYQLLVQKAEKLKVELLRYETDVLRLEKLRKSFPLNPTGIDQETLVSETSAAIQQSAQSNGVKLVMMHESPGRTSAALLSSMRLEGQGQMLGVIKFLEGMTRLGFPLVLDSVQLTADPKKPGMLTINLEVMVMDYHQFETEDEKNA